MHDNEERGDPFRGLDLWANSALLTQVPGVELADLPEIASTKPREWPDVSAGSIFDKDPFSFPIADESQWLKTLPGLHTFQSSVKSTETSSTDTEDVWSISTDDLDGPRRLPTKSWESYSDPAFREPCQFLSEAGVSVFEVVLRDIAGGKSQGRPLKPHAFLKSLFQLGMGRDSALFRFNADGTFSVRMTDPRMYGLTAECTKSVIARFGACGRLLRSLKTQINRIYRRQQSPPASVATAQAISSVLLELDTQITAQYPTNSLIQLQTAFKAPFMTLTLMRDILHALPNLDTDAKVLTYLFDLAQEVERSEPCLKPLIAQVLNRASEPWLRAATACVGLRPMDAACAALHSSLSEEVDLDEELDATESIGVFPQWFKPADRALVRQIFEEMNILESQGYRAAPSATQNDALLTWHFSWADIIRAESSQDSGIDRAHRRDPSESPPHSLELLALDSIVDPFDAIRDSYQLLESGGPRKKHESDLQKTIEALLRGHDTGTLANVPSFEMSALNSFRPLLAARARDINHACLKELFRSGSDLRSGHPLTLTYHLTILNRFLLMGDGMFTTKLSHALFDPELASAERSKGRARYGSMGLRLGSRTTWPPASSELQLALMGILTAAFDDDQVTTRSHELPGDLSFSLRHLSEDEIQQCLDQKSLEALDFLRMQYRPAPPLDAVITQPILEKYDAIQRLLLRMTRLIFVVNHQSRMRWKRNEGRTPLNSVALRFVQAAHHFVTGFTDYLLNTAIGANWPRFSHAIAELEKSLGGDQADVTELRGIAYVRELHERTLESIMFASLLRKRHEKVRALFEDILRLVLAFAAMQDPREDLVAELYGKFKKQVGVFINVCRGLGDRKEYAVKEEGLHALVTRLTMNDFYSSNTERVLRL